MHCSLIFAVTIAVLGFASATLTTKDKEMMCEHLEGIEMKRHMMLESLSRKAAALGRAAIEILPLNSNFEKCMEQDILFSHLTQSDESAIAFLNKFKCAYKRKILCNWNYQDQPEFREMYNNWRSESNEIIKKFDRELVETNQDLLGRRSWSTLPNRNEFINSVNSYLKRYIKNTHSLFNHFLNSSKSKYECTYKIGYL
ncbi:uncharacterized protein LOC108162492 [Drosophila miranda]|uniref:uncharacterized protein LOC108162492 n=1 Tax=Drosophila miranda TaxID=7229 RepID=UPI0007E62EFD|nr:uncharacterized protein LOC108162492 [Drosophila miranda]